MVMMVVVVVAEMGVVMVKMRILMTTRQGSMRSELSDLHSLVRPKHKLTRGIFAIFGSTLKVIRQWSTTFQWTSPRTTM